MFTTCPIITTAISYHRASRMTRTSPGSNPWGLATATGFPEGRFMQLCWLENKQFYTLSTAVSTPCTPYLVKTGANDPDYNLVTRNGMLLRTSSPVANHTYVSVIEPHGSYDLVNRRTDDPARRGRLHIHPYYDQARQTPSLRRSEQRLRHETQAHFPAGAGTVRVDGQLRLIQQIEL